MSDVDIVILPFPFRATRTPVANRLALFSTLSPVRPENDDGGKERVTS